MKILRAAARLLTYAAAAYGACVAYTFFKYGKQKRARPASSLDRFIPEPEVIEEQSVRVDAPPNMIYDIVRRHDLLHSPVARLLFGTRGIVLGAEGARGEMATNFVEQMKQVGWTILDEKPGEEIIFGVAAQPWVADAGFRTLGADFFATFNEPGWVKFVLNVTVDSGGTLRTETRVVCTDAAARRRFRKYWAFVLPGVKLIRFELLRAIKVRAEVTARIAAA